MNSKIKVKITEYLRQNPRIELAYLYGSSLSRRDFEDIDLAVRLKGKKRRIKDRDRLPGKLPITDLDPP